MSAHKAKLESEGSIDSRLDLASLIDKFARRGTNWIFRGEPSTTDELRPAAGGKGECVDAARTLKYDIDNERAALKRFGTTLARHVGWHYKWESVAGTRRVRHARTACVQ